MFDVKKVTNEIIDFIRTYYKENNLKGAVIGISGGKDSGVVAGLFSKAIGAENVVGIWMPCHSKETDYKRKRNNKRKRNYTKIQKRSSCSNLKT